MSAYYYERNWKLLLRAAERIPSKQQATIARALILRASAARAEATVVLVSPTADYRRDFLPRDRKALLKLIAAVRFIKRALDEHEDAFRLLWRINDVFKPWEMVSQWRDSRREMGETLGYAGQS